jgi:DNA ligase-3
MQSVFLMGVFDPLSQQWKTVCKVGNGFTDEQLKAVHEKLLPLMIRCPQPVPTWLDVSSAHRPDFILSSVPCFSCNPPVWEIAGAEFSYSSSHTAPFSKEKTKEGISIRFPRIVKVRDDKNYHTATSLKELQTLFKESQKGVSLSSSSRK